MESSRPKQSSFAEDTVVSSDSTALTLYENPVIHRNVYWVEILQLFCAFTIVEWIRPIRNHGDPLNIMRQLLHISLDSAIQLGYGLWDTTMSRIDDGEQIQEHHTLEFVFVLIRDFLDQHLHSSPCEKAKLFYQVFLEAFVAECACSACVSFGNVWAALSDDEKREHLKFLELDNHAITRAEAEMLTWNTEPPSTRQSQQYHDIATNDYIDRRSYGALGAEIQLLSLTLNVSRIGFILANDEMGWIKSPSDLEAVERVTSPDTLTETECLICYEKFELLTDADEEGVMYRYPIKARCGHVTCLKCHTEWVTNENPASDSCSMCRTTFVPLPEHKQKYASVLAAIDGSEQMPDDTATNLISAIEQYYESLPPEAKAHSIIKAGDLIWMQSLLEGVLGSSETLLGMAAAPRIAPIYYHIRANRATSVLKLGAERLRAFQEGDTPRYREVVQEMWPHFLQLQMLTVMTEVLEWLKQHSRQ